MTAPLVIAIDRAELAVRMCEASYGLKRPMPSAAEALAAMEPEPRAGWLRAADAAFAYFAECLDDG